MTYISYLWDWHICHKIYVMFSDTYVLHICHSKHVTNMSQVPIPLFLESNICHPNEWHICHFFDLWHICHSFPHPQNGVAMGHRLLWRVLRDGFLHFHGQLSQPQTNLKNDDRPEPKPPASSFFPRPNFHTLVPVVAPRKIWCVRAGSLEKALANEHTSIEPTAVAYITRRKPVGMLRLACSVWN